VQVDINSSTAVQSANVESWNGTSWTEVTDLNTGRDIATGGISTSIGLSALEVELHL
jgi:hypothetical protein